MNARYILPALALAAAPLYAGPAVSAVPPVDKLGLAAQVTCPTPLNAAAIYHFDKIVFMIIGQLHAATVGIPTDQAALNALPLNTELDIKIRDNPRTVADLKSKVLSFLGAAVDPENAKFIQIREVTYTAVVCPKSP
jgi:hypothetical protein